VNSVIYETNGGRTFQQWLFAAVSVTGYELTSCRSFLMQAWREGVHPRNWRQYMDRQLASQAGLSV